jgi:hypothetical protein
MKILGPYIHTSERSDRQLLGSAGGMGVMLFLDHNWMTSYFGIQYYTREAAMNANDLELIQNGYILIDDQIKFDKLKALI